MTNNMLGKTVVFTCKCGFENVFLGLPAKAQCAKCGTKITKEKT